jgi:hypothetical protein
MIAQFTTPPTAQSASERLTDSTALPAPVHHDPLMQPVTYQGQAYYTSQYFHRQYIANSQAGGKHRRYDHFIHVLRSIEAYATYVEHGDIRTLYWQQLKEEQPGNLGYFTSLFRATGYQPLTLLNATAQAALSHHLDDELSKQMSVAINTTIARQATRKAGLLPAEQAARELTAHLDVATRLGVPAHIGQQEAVKLVQASTGIDYRPLLKAAPAQEQVARDAMMLEPTDLARALGLTSGQVMNTQLAALGWQVKQIGGGWAPTKAGERYSHRHAWTGEYSTKSGYNWKWNLEAVRAALEV